MQKIQTLFCSRHGFLFDPSKKLNCATQWIEVLKLQNTCEVFCLYSLRIGSPLLFPILSPSHYLEQILWCHFSCQLISFLFKTQGVWCMHVQKPFICIVPTLVLWITWFNKIPRRPNANVFYLMCGFHIAKHWIFFSEMQVV